MSHLRQENEGDNEVALRRYVEIMLHWWWLFLIVPVAVLPMLLSKGSAEPVVRYETDTRILIQSVGSGLSDLLANQRLPQLYVELVTERDMLVEVREELGLSDSVETMQGWISAIEVPGTSILELQVTHTDPVVAAAVANKLAEVFIVRTQERRLAEVGRL
jgi:capsular polysaccharide biosynthesis protein